MKRKIGIVILGIGGLGFLFFPDVVNRGAKTGLILWFHTVLPALLPFMILSVFMIRQNITGIVSRLAAPVFGRLFGISGNGCYPALIGFLSGYPVGARTTAQVYEKGMISKGEAQYILSFCNNASPMFLLEYIGLECMNLSVPVQVCLLIYLSVWINSLIERVLWKRGRYGTDAEGGDRADKPVQSPVRENWIASLDASILDAFTVITKIGGYMILFSIAARWLEDFLPVSEMAKYIGIGVLEITTGGALIARLSMPAWLQGGIFLALCAFGGLSSVAQTASVLSDTDLSVSDYILAKIRQAVLAFCLGGIWFIIKGTI